MHFVLLFPYLEAGYFHQVLSVPSIQESGLDRLTWHAEFIQSRNR